MSDINWDLFKCRCSKINDFVAGSKDNPCITEIQEKELAELRGKLDSGKALTENQKARVAELKVKEENKGKVILSTGAIEYLMEYYAWVTAQKLSVGKELNMIEYCEKGTAVEPQSITLLSLVEEVYYSDNKHIQIFNDFSTGEPDIFVGKEGIYKAKKITDIKSSFDYPIFLKKIKAKPDVGNDKQVKGYMDITGAQEGEIAHCLVNMTIEMVLDYRWRLFRKMRPVTEEDPDYKRACEKMERSMYFDDIPRHKRVFKIPVNPFTNFERQQFHDKVKIGRQWLYNFHEEMEQLNK